LNGRGGADRIFGVEGEDVINGGTEERYHIRRQSPRYAQW
jgi:hypothetical protein